MADYEAHFRFDETDGSDDDDDDIEKKRERKTSSEFGDGGDDTAERRASVTSKYSNFAGFGSSEEERQSAFEETPETDKTTAANQSRLRLNISGFDNCLYSSIRMSCAME